MVINRDKIVKTVVDIGNAKIKAITGELSSNGEVLKVLKYVEGPSVGMIKNEIRDAEELSKAINNVIEELRIATEQEIDSITIGIGGEKIKSRTVNMEYSFHEEEITEDHIKALLEDTKKKILTSEEQLIKTEIYNIRVDNSGIVKNPLGVLGSKLQGDVHLIYTEKKRVAKLVETINRIGVDVENIVLNAYASAKSTLGEEDSRMGVALADIGEGSTDIILYKNDKLIYTETIPLGGMHFKTDLIYILKLNEEEEAIEILNKYRNKDISPEGYIYYGEGKYIAALELESFINARVEEIIDYIKDTIEKSGFNGYLGKGLILTGGAVSDRIINVEKLLETINKKTGYVARKVLPSEFSGLEEVTTSMATVIGIFYEVMEEEDRKLKTGSYTHQEIKVKNEKIIQPIEEEKEDLSKMLEEESVEEEKEKRKNGVLKAVKNWFSNFI
ncbi:Cell division protein FtsA [Fusobacterium necrogenes]|uniref:Cell division protein FtsA n=1 Tax=Fusobacterium necrogenes TaxID=858 RepID=A0A377H031_9FUSO|nr:cell division protein FtsA [Fusobacterium necrogenes]STO32184.1 Cell division protein FtsA [Fusobacterium necrogenes]